MLGTRNGRALSRRPLLLLGLLLALIGLLPVGCSSTHFVRVNPGESIDLAQDEALIALHVDSDLPLDRLVLTGLVLRDPIPAGQHFWIARVYAGNYTWKVAHVASGPFKGRYRIKRSVYERPGELDLEIVAGRLNYAGELIVRRGTWGWTQSSISFRLRNHAGQAVRRIERDYPELLDRFSLHTSGTSGDRFLEFYLEERARVATQTGAASGDAPPGEVADP